MQQDTQIEQTMSGIPLSPGFALAPVCLFRDGREDSVPAYCVLDGGEEQEKARFHQARAAAERDLKVIAGRVRERVGEAEAGIFEAHVMILQDPALYGDVDALIDKERLNAEAAVAEVLDSYEVRLQEIDDAYLRERASDFGEIKRRLLVELGGGNETGAGCSQGECTRGADCIVVAGELTPQLTMELETDHVRGFVTERGGRNSHGAILARALGIPAVSGVAGVCDKVRCGAPLLVSGSTGKVALWPGRPLEAQWREREPVLARIPAPCPPVKGLRVLANLSVPGETALAMKMQAEGIGLYRTEIEVIAGLTDCNEDALFESYRSVLESYDGGDVTFRLFDIGSDKRMASLMLPPEQNPSLGLRGARLLLKNRDLLVCQARALARASLLGPVSVLYPMIVDLAQYREIRTVFEEAIAGMESRIVRHGVMFEVPSACLQAEEILAEADFGSIGTNDLTQYTFAVDRDNEHMADAYDPDHPVIWGLLAQVVDAARRTKKPISACGELAGRPEHIGRLMALGIRTVSVSVRLIPALREAARQINGAASRDGDEAPVVDETMGTAQENVSPLEACVGDTT
jgi:phosphotransferase system enzyme I (PtsI)